MKVGFVGLGVMGAPMAGYLIKAGFDVFAYNRGAEKAKSWEARFDKQATTTLSDLWGCEAVCLCVGNDDDVRSVVTVLLKGLAAGSCIIDHTTASAALAEEMSALCAKQGVGFVDAPVSGGQAGAENGVLTIMVGANDDWFNRAEPVMKAYAKQITHMGGSGRGQITKMVNQILIAGLLQGLSEGVSLAKNAGLNMEDLVATLKHGAAGSWQLENRAVTMAKDEFNFGFALDLMRKDLGIVADYAKDQGLSLPVTDLVHGFYDELSQQGFGRMDTSALIKRLV